MMVTSTSPGWRTPDFLLLPPMILEIFQPGFLKNLVILEKSLEFCNPRTRLLYNMPKAPVEPHIATRWQYDSFLHQSLTTPVSDWNLLIEMALREH
jgi:hypothetical protein